MNLYDDSFLCLDIGDFSVKAVAHSIRDGKIIKSALQTVESRNTSFALKSAIDELEKQLQTRFDSAFITGNFGNCEFKTLVKTTCWDSPHKITNSDIQNQLLEITDTDDLYPMHIFPLRYDTGHVSNLLTPIGKIDTKLTSVFGVIFYNHDKTNEIYEILRHAHIQAKKIFDSPYLMNLNFRTPKENALFIDFGGGATTVSLWTDRGPVFLEKIAFGGEHITKQIAQKLCIKTIEIKKIKHAIASIKPDEMDRFTPADGNYDFSRADLNDILISSLTDLIYKISDISGDAIKKYNPKKIFISGGGSNIKSIDEFVSNIFKLPVQNLGGDGALRALSDIVWKSQESNINKYLLRRKKIKNLYSGIFSGIKKKKITKRFIPIMPSTLAFDMKNPATYNLFKSGNISVIHIDIMDGFFVNRVTGGINELKLIRNQTDAHLHVHLMTESPNTWAAAAAENGAGTIIVSTGTAGVRTALATIKKMGVRCGIALNPETDVSILKPVLKELDEIMILAVSPGAGGQQFDLSVLNKISVLANTRKKYDLKYKISVDGGINPDTAKLCWQAGADLLVSGSYLTSAPDFALAVQKLLP